METDPEIKEGRDQHYTTFFRQYDPRLGRWWSHDPVKQMGESPYAAMFNNPVLFGDALGSDPETGGGSGTEAGPVDGGGGTGGGNGGGSTGGLIPLLDGYVDRQIFGPSGRPKQGDGTRTSDGMFRAHSPTTGGATGAARGTQQNIPPPPVANALPADFVPPAGESLGPADVEPSDWQKGVDLVDRTLHDPIVSQSFPFIGAGAVLFDIVDDGVGAATTLYSTHVSGGTTFPRGLNGESLDGKEQKEVLLHTFINVEGIAIGGLPGLGKNGATVIDDGATILDDLARSRLSSVADDAAGASGQGVNRIYSARVLVSSAEEPGSFHNFPESFNEVIFQNGTKTITPNYFNVAKPGYSNTNILYRYPGTINGTRGFYEIAVRPSLSGRTEVIIHRFFNPIR